MENHSNHDGSTDNSAQILKKFKKKLEIKCYF